MCPQEKLVIFAHHRRIMGTLHRFCVSQGLAHVRLDGASMILLLCYFCYVLILL